MATTAFDPEKEDFEVIAEAGFDPASQDFEVIEESGQTSEPDEFGIGQEVRGVGRGIKRGFATLKQAGNVLDLNFRAKADELTRLRIEDARERGDTEEVARLSDFAGFNRDMMRRDFAAIATQDERIRGIPVAPDMQNLHGDFWKTLASNPIEVIATVTAESLPVALPGLVAGGLMAGPAGSAVGVGAGSLAVEYSLSLMESVREANGGVVTPEAIEDTFSDPVKMEAFRTKALKRGIPVAFFDGVSGGIAGRHVRAFTKTTSQSIGKAAKATAKDVGEQMALGSGGETAGQVVSEGTIESVPDIVLEGLAESGSGSVEIAQNVLKARKAGSADPKDPEVSRSRRKATPVPKPEVPRGTEDTVETAEAGGTMVVYTTPGGQQASVSVPTGKSVADTLKIVERLGGKNPRVVVVPGVAGTPAPKAAEAANATALVPPPETPETPETESGTEAEETPVETPVEAPVETPATSVDTEAPEGVTVPELAPVTDEPATESPATEAPVATETPPVVEKPPTIPEGATLLTPDQNTFLGVPFKKDTQGKWKVVNEGGFLVGVSNTPEEAVSDFDRQKSEADRKDSGKDPRVQTPVDESVKGALSPVVEASNKIAEWVKSRINSDQPFTAQELYDWAAGAFGSPMAEGKWTAKDATDAMELGVNRYIRDNDVTPESLQELLGKLPTQTRRTEEQNEFQQFSTPPPLAMAAVDAAGIVPDDVVLEPSAGLGGLATFAKKRGARVVVNELSERRRALLEREGYDQAFGENAEQLDNVLPADVRPTVVVMNPPFSATAGRIPGKRSTAIGASHVEQALKRLQPGGRLVAIVGEGMGMDAPAFRDWWRGIRGKYNVRANVWVSGKAYAKYGTTFPNRLLIIDKDGATATDPITGEAQTVSELRKLIAPAKRKYERPIEPAAPEGGTPQPEQPAESTRDQAPAGDGPEIAAGGAPSGVRPDAMGSGEQPRGTGRPPTGVAPSVPEPVNPVAETASSAGSDRAESGRTEVPRGEQPSPSSAPAVAEPQRQPEREQSELGDVTQAERQQVDVDDSVVFEAYQPRIVVPGAKPHPTKLSESAAMASVDPPKTTYVPNLPGAVISEGLLSDAQLETTVLAGQSHEQTLPSDERRGFFIGDGTGVGKGREIAAIIFDNWRRGRRKAVWVSQKKALVNDARRDLSGIGFDEKKVIDRDKAKGELKQSEGVLFVTYDTLKSRPKDKGKRSQLEEVVKWLGKDFDGVIAFDESHSMANAIVDLSGGRGKQQPSARAVTGIELQRLLPKARIVYVSATGATEVKNLAYAPRLGLWGEGTPFATVREFVREIAAGGVAAMEQVAKDMKALGMYLARQLDFSGVGYRKIEHTLTSDQAEIYNTVSRAWQTVLRNMEAALDLTGGNNSATAKRNAKGQFWAAHQRFFNQVITSMQMPSIMADAKKEIAAGNAVVFQLVNTNEAATERALGEQEAEGMDEENLEELDLTPREQLIGFVQKSFPVIEYTETIDANGNVVSVPVRDSQGNFVENREAVAMRDALIEQLQAVRVPDGPLDIIIRELGPENVAEVTGRKRRVVRGKKKDGTEGMVIEKRSKNSGVAEADQFMADKRRALVFSNAGGTGRSYHADLSAKNQRPRRHYIVQPGWVADAAVQGFGRSHRSNQRQPPEFILTTTNLEAQKRFVSSIARRLDQLGALTKGERKAGGQGMFTLRDNLENQYAQDALMVFYQDVLRGTVDGVDQAMVENTMGLSLTSQSGQKKAQLPGIKTFLNRLLSLETDQMSLVFKAFSERLDNILRAAEAAGTLDQGLETLEAISTEVLKETVIYTEPKTGSQTKHVELEMTQKNPRASWARAKDATIGYVRNNASGRIWAVMGKANRTRENGSVIEEFRLLGVTGNQWLETIPEDRWTKLSKEEAQTAWENEYDATPNTRKEIRHVVTGIILPIWDRIPGNPRIVRVITGNKSLIGRLISQKDLPSVLKALGVTATAPKMTPAEYLNAVYDGGARIELSNGWSIKRSRVAGDDRVELSFGSAGLSYGMAQQLKSQGVFSEQHQFRFRYFIPPSNPDVLERLLVGKDVVDIQYPGAGAVNSLGTMPAEQYAGMEPGEVDAAIGNMVAGWQSGPTIRIVNDPTWKKNGHPVEAEYDPEQGLVTLNAAFLRDAQHAQQVLAEEALAHYGLEAVFGDDLGRVLDEISVPDAELFEVARTYGLDISDPAQRRLAVAEWLGKRAQTEQAKGWLARVLTEIADWWNRMTGYRPPEQFARELLARASEFLTSGRARQRFWREPMNALGDNIENIEAAADEVNVKADIERPVSTYKPIGRFEMAMTKVRRESELIRRYDQTGKLLPLRGQLEVKDAWQAAAIKEQASQLRRQLFADSKASMVSKWPSWIGGPSWRKRALRFADLALPVASYLNVTGRKPTGEFQFSDFDMRAGTMTKRTFDAGGHTVGDRIIVDNPLTGLPEELVIGPQITTSKGVQAYQLLREMPATRQEEIYGHYAGQYPDLSWFLDMWIDPDLASMRMNIGGVDIPVFNRFAIAEEMKKNDPTFSALDGYTPDVLVNRSLMGAIIGAMQGISRGAISPGRRYKTGRTRESGNVRDLLSGFSIRAFQAAREQSRRQWTRAVLAAGVPVPAAGVPEGWVELGDALSGLLKMIRAVGRMDPSAPFAEVLKRLANDGTPEYKQLLVEAHRLNNKNRMIPKPLLDSVLQQYQAQETRGTLATILDWVVRNAKGLLLVHPKTILGNVLTNEFFALETASRYALAGLLKLNPNDLRFARNIMTGLLLNRFAGLRLNAQNVFGPPADGSYMAAVQTVLPPEIFAGNTGLSDIQVQYSDSAIDLLKKGEIAAWALQAVQYGAIDLRAKQRMAYAWLKAAAVSAAKRKGLSGDALKQDVIAYLKQPPVEDVARAVGAANFELLNYADSPAFIAAMSRSSWGSMIMPFPRFGYHFLAKQGQRLAAVKKLLGNVPAAQRADAFADLVVVGMYGLGGVGAVMAFAGGDDDDAREFAGTKSIRYIDDKGNERVEPISPELNTFNRLNISYWARASGLGGDGEEDFWIRVRTYPVLAAAGIGAIAMDDARQLGIEAGVKSYVTGIGDLLGDFLSLGVVARLPGKVWASAMEEATGRTQQVPFDNYATGVPFMAWLGKQVSSTFVPGQRQADELIMWIDPTYRRSWPSQSLGYEPGFWDGLRIGGTVGLLDRLASGGESTLPPAGRINRTTGEVTEPRQIDPMTRLWSLGGINAKMVNREEYEKALK